ncbi:hypothetical protein JB92DRAFT_2864548 [Gautieria morchelliformis]|nr:hypothetical protein JB92DRAFT_2864548 [Gautieria morchelliformis]
MGHPTTNDNKTDLPSLQELGLLSLTQADALAYREYLANRRLALPPLPGNAPDRPPLSLGLPKCPRRSNSSGEKDGGEARARDKGKGRVARRGTPRVLPSQQHMLNNRTLGSRLDGSLEAAPVERFSGAARRVDESPTLVRIDESIPGMTDTKILEGEATQGDGGRGEGSSRRTTRREYKFRACYFTEDGMRMKWVEHERSRPETPAGIDS